MNYYIITGTSRGIGEALAKKLISKNSKVFCIARSESEYLKNISLQSPESVKNFIFDVSETDKIESLISEIIGSISLKKGDSIYLINNAGVIQPIAPLEKCNHNDISKAISVNYTAPMILSSVFISKTKKFNGCKRIINMSSGAGLHPYHGWSSYCTTKAALTMLTRCIAVEQQFTTNPVEVISVAPGIIETNMQEQIRSVSKDDFANLDFFVDFKKHNKSKTPDYAAEKILNLINSDKFKSGEFYDFIEL